MRQRLLQMFKWVFSNLLWELITSSMSLALLLAVWATVTTVTAGVLAYLQGRSPLWVFLAALLTLLLAVLIANGVATLVVRVRAGRQPPFNPEEWKVSPAGTLIHASALSPNELTKPELGVGCQIESDRVVEDTETYVIRISLNTEVNIGQVAAYLVGADGFPLLTTALPLGWSNENTAIVRLGSAVPVWVFLGFLAHVRGQTGFMLSPAGPGFPNRHLHTPIRPPVGNRLSLRLRIVRVDVGDYWDINVQVAYSKPSGLPECSAQLTGS